MYCITRDDMKFGEFFVPAGTKGTIISNLKTQTVDASGVTIDIAIKLLDIKINGNEHVLVSDTKIENELEKRADSVMDGIVVSTNTTKVYMDADARLYQDKEIYEWQVEKIFPDGIPSNIQKAEYDKRKYMLNSIIYYLEDEFAEWVQKNCHFQKVTKRDIENGDAFDGAEPGDRMLSDSGVKQFKEMRNEYQGRLHRIGFTYDFRGGLIWD